MVISRIFGREDGRPATGSSIAGSSIVSRVRQIQESIRSRGSPKKDLDQQQHQQQQQEQHQPEIREDAEYDLESGTGNHIKDHEVHLKATPVYTMAERPITRGSVQQSLRQLAEESQLEPTADHRVEFGSMEDLPLLGQRPAIGWWESRFGGAVPADFTSTSRDPLSLNTGSMQNYQRVHFIIAVTLIVVCGLVLLATRLSFMRD